MNQLISCALLAFLPFLQAVLQPGADSRTEFGPDFYRRASFDVDEDYKNSLVLSPAGVQKFLTVIYKGTEPKQADRMLFDYGVKHIDMKRFRKIVEEETGSSDIGFSPDIHERLMEELAELCSKDDVVKYFEDDFSIGTDSTVVKNTIVVPKGLTPKAEFTDFAKKYFNTDIIQRNADERTTDTEDIELISNIKMTTKLNDSYTLANGNINAVVEAKYYEDDELQYIDLPLENGLTIFIALGADHNKLSFYITQAVGRHVQDFNDFYKNKWQTEKVLVHLPTIKVRTENDLKNYFTEGTAREGVRTMLRKDAKLTEAFENWTTEHKVDSFLQNVEFNLDSADNTNAVNGPPTKTFDATGKTFFFVVKSDKAFYIIGHYNGSTE